MPTRLSTTLAASVGLALVGIHFAGSPTRASEAQPTPTPVAADWNVCQPLDPRADGHWCPAATCGDNTPLINTFPLDGVHAGGCANADGRRIVDGSLTPGRGHCPDRSMTLDVDQGRLVGRDPTTGSVVCRGAALVGAVFTVEATRDRDQDGQPGEPFNPPRATRIRISQMGTLAEGSSRFAAYVFTPEHDPARSLCSPTDAAPWLEQWLAPPGSDLPVPRLHPPIETSSRAVSTVSAGEASRFAILIEGEVFDRTALPFELKGARHWFNIACADAALAKIRIRGLDKSPTSTAERKAALKMTTAKYRDGVSYTTKGVTIDWRKNATSGPGVEAQWNEDGATCLSHARLWRPNTLIPGDALGTTCADFSCDETAFLAEIRDTTLKDCTDPTYVPPTGKKVFWTSYVVDHIDHPRP